MTAPFAFDAPLGTTPVRAPELTLPPDAPADYAFRRGDTVVWHATFFDYEAEVIQVLPATGFAPERLSLYVDTDYAGLKWVTVHASRCAIVLVEAAEALEAARATSA